jgi:hypothetical protein
VRLEPPLDPSSPQARRWLEDELRRPIYNEQPGLLERLQQWLSDLFDRTAGGGSALPGWTIVVIVALLVAVLALVLLIALRRERRMGSTRPAALFDGPVRTAGEHRQAARAALTAGDHSTAALEAYRAIARAAVERTLTDDLPGRTAHELSLALAPVFPGAAVRLAAAADLFDAIRYGHRQATAAAARDVLALDTDLAAAKPVLPDLVGAAGGPGHAAPGAGG